MKIQDAPPLKLWVKLRIQYGFGDAKEAGTSEKGSEKVPNRSETALWSCDYVCTSGCQGHCMGGCQGQCMSDCQYTRMSSLK
jgi:hypothetical protein